MSFLRTKTIHGNQYCYLVENYYTKNGPRQKVKKYLGRAFRIEPKPERESNFFNYFQIKDLNIYLKKSKKEVLNDLIKFELTKHGFKEQKNLLLNLPFFYNDFKIIKNQKEAILSLNQGFLCSFTLKRILDFKKTKDLQKDAKNLAKYFVEAGIQIPPEIFIDIYKKS